MRDLTREELEDGRPSYGPSHTIGYCLEQIFKDRMKSTKDLVVGYLTFEELIGALLQARDLAEAAEAEDVS
jgi:hypothetical protein